MPLLHFVGLANMNRDVAAFAGRALARRAFGAGVKLVVVVHQVGALGGIGMPDTDPQPVCHGFQGLTI